MQRGFTLIELLVVISIIGLLASVVLASLSSARVNASDATVESELKEAANQLELAYTGGGYGPTLSHVQCPTVGASIFVTDAKLSSLIVSAGAASALNYVDCATGGSNSANASSWAMAAPFQARNGLYGLDGQYWCVDSSGTGKLSSAHEHWYDVALRAIVPKAFASAGPPYHGPDLGGGASAAKCP